MDKDRLYSQVREGLNDGRDFHEVWSRASNDDDPALAWDWAVWANVVDVPRHADLPANVRTREGSYLAKLGNELDAMW